MRKVLTALVAVAAIGTAAVATSGTAEARWWGPGPVRGRRRRRRRCRGGGNGALLLRWPLPLLWSVRLLCPGLSACVERLLLDP
jgi:hypothetical protein